MVYTDHASLRTAINSPHISQRMARWLSFFAEYNFCVEYKPGRLNVVADALSRRPDLEPARADASVIAMAPTSALTDDIVALYEHDQTVTSILEYLRQPSDASLAALSPRARASISRYELRDSILYYRSVVDEHPRIVVPNGTDLRLRVLYEYHDAPTCGHRGRDKTYATLCRDFYWPRQYAFVHKYVRSCEVCQRSKPPTTTSAPLQPLPIASDCWRSVSMDFIFGLPEDSRGNTGVLVFVDRFSKMVHLIAVPATISAAGSARIFVDTIFRLHGMPDDLISDRDPRFTNPFWETVFSLVGTRLRMSTTDHPQTDGQTERANRVLEEILRSYAHAFDEWSDFLSLTEFSINNSVHASTGHTPFFVNALRHPRLPTTLGGVPHLSGGGTRVTDDMPSPSSTIPSPHSASAKPDDLPVTRADLALDPTVPTLVRQNGGCREKRKVYWLASSYTSAKQSFAS